MPTPTYTPIATITLASTDSEIVFSSIPATYRDLIVVVNVKMATGAVDWGRIKFNSSSSGYSWVNMAGTGSTTASESVSSETAGRISTYARWSTTQFTNVITQIMDYSATDKHKTFLSRANDPAVNGVEAEASRWASTDAIHTIQIYQNDLNPMAIGSTFSLYGISA